MTIRLSRRAHRDLDDIQRYTVETWICEQWLTCYQGLVRTFERTAAGPESGRDRSQFVSGLPFASGFGRYRAWKHRILPVDGTINVYSLNLK